MSKNSASLPAEEVANKAVEAVAGEAADDPETKNLILSEAVRLFSRDGFNGVSMRDLAKAVKITPGALYYHYPNKKSLHEAAVLYAYRFRARPAVAVLGDSDKSPMETLEKFVLRLCERFYHDHEFRRLVQWTILYSGPDENIRNILITVVYETHFDSLVTFLKKFDLATDPYRLTIFIFGMVMQNYFTLDVRKDHHGYDEKLEDPKQLTSEIMAILESGAFRKKPK